MKRVLLGVTVLGAAAVLIGCPIYSDSSGGDYQVCDTSGCYDCPDNVHTNACVPWSCNGSGDCPYGYTCDINGACVTTPEIDAGSGYCGQGCPSGYVCAIANGLAQCAPLGAIPVDDSGTYVGVLDASPIQSQDAWVMLDAPAGDDSALSTDTGSLADASSGDAGSFATDANLADVIEASILEASTSEASTSEASTPEAGGGAEGGPLGGLCNADSQCANTGAKCIDGLCTAQSQLCTDGTQCLAAGEVCIDGVCLPTCSGSSACPAGYGCDYAVGVCDLNPAPCTGSSACLGGAVCVEGHCAAPCSSADAGAACANGQVCVNGGCIPDQQAQFTCAIDGASCSLVGGSIGVCVHGDCYAGCPDGGGCGTAAPVCKEVPGNKGQYAICGTSTNLGNECNPAVGSYCGSSQVCADGYCK